MSIESIADETVDLRKARRQRVTARPTVDRLPPHSPEAEQGVLGCCLLSPKETLGECIEKIGDRNADAFYDLRHQTIFMAMVEMFDRAEEIDIITIQQNLKNKQMLEQCGGITYLSQLQDAVPSAANLSYYLDIVHEKHLLRKMISVCTELVGRVYDYEGEVDQLLDEVERDVMAIRPIENSHVDIKSLTLSAIDKIEKKAMSGGKIQGLSTGIPDLDRLTDGLHPAEYITIAALPSRGKTVTGVNIVVHNALNGIPGAILSAEMLPVQLVVRSICSEARVNYKHVCEEDIVKMTFAARKISAAPLYIERASGFTIGQVRAVARRLKQQHGIKILLIDFLQLLSGSGDTKEQEVSSISKGIKALAMELEIPILLLSQLNKEGGTKYAAAVTEDTDGLWKLENNGDWQSKIQPLTLNVEKCRDGETGSIDLTFFKEFTRIEQASRFSESDIPKTQPC